MPVSNPSGLFGLHQLVIEDRTTGKFAQMLIVADFEIDGTSEQIKLEGGSAQYPWGTAPGMAGATANLTLRQYDLNIFKYLCGKDAIAFTENVSGDANGNFSAFENVQGTSVFSATTGVASASAVGGGDPKFGTYVIQAASATTVNVYLSTNIDGVPYLDDELKINASPLTITTAGNVAIPGTNIQLTGGSGTIGMTVGHTARINVRPKNSYNFQYRGGVPGVNPPEFGLHIYYEKDDTRLRELYLPRVKANGVSFNGSSKEWSECESELIILQDAAKGYAYEYRTVDKIAA